MILFNSNLSVHDSTTKPPRLDNYGLLLYLKLARVDVGNVSKKGENMEGIITWSIFANWLTKSVYIFLTIL